MLGVLVFGVGAYGLLPVAPLPNVDFPTITVTASFPGASPQTMASAIATPLEQQFTSIPALTQMTSLSGIGTMTITLQFDLSRNIDGAAVDVVTAINAASGLLPKDLPNPPTYKKVNPADFPIMIYAVHSDAVPDYRLDDYANTILAERLSTVPGVGQVSIFGQKPYAARVQVNPGALAAHGIGLEDVRSALTNATVNLPKGSIEGPHEIVALETNDQLFDATAYGNVIVAYRNGAPVRLKDVGNVVNSVQNERVGAWFNNLAAEGIAIQKAPGTNTIQLVDTIKALMPKLQQSIPPSVHVDLMLDRTLVTRAAVRDVQLTMLLTIALVIVVIFVFLRTIWATVIPSLAVPLSLLATFGVMWAVGFSLDNISLMGLTISVGFIVDDAIVMIENIVRYIEQDAALRSRAQRCGTDRLYDHFDHLFADCGVHPAVLHGRHHRPAVPRVRGHGVGRGSGLGGRLVDPDAGVVLAVPKGARPAPSRPFQPGGRTLFRLDDRSLRPGAQFRLPPSIRGADVDLPADVGDRVPLCGNSQGLLPAAGHGHGLRRSRYAAGCLVPHDSRDCPQGGRHYPPGSERRRRFHARRRLRI